MIHSKRDVSDAETMGNIMDVTVVGICGQRVKRDESLCERQASVSHEEQERNEALVRSIFDNKNICEMEIVFL